VSVVNAMFKTENYDQQHIHINDGSESSAAPAVARSTVAGPSRQSVAGSTCRSFPGL